MASNPIRILHLIASNFVGGPEKQILHHSMDLRDWGFKVWVGSFRDRPEKTEILRLAEENLLPTYESQSSGRFNPQAVFELSSFLKLEKIQLLCTHGFKANTVGALAKNVAHVPQIAFCRGWTAETLRIRGYEALERRFLALADRIICVSDAQAEYFATRHLLQPRIVVVHNAMLDSIGARAVADREASKLQLGFSSSTRLIGAVGRLSYEKGQRYLIQAAPKLLCEFNDLKIVLLGEGREEASLKRQLRKLGLEDVVVMPGFQKNVARWMQAFDVLANCSLTEGIPNAILEAMATGTPVVATSVGGVPELIKHRETGLLVEAENPEELAQALAEVLKDPVFSSQLSQAGRDCVQRNFSASGQRDSLLRIYREVLKLSPNPTEPPSRSPEPERIVSHLSRVVDAEHKYWPLLSIVIPVRNEEAHLGNVLDNLLAQDYPADRYEILVADGESTDATPQVVEKAAKGPVRLKLLLNSRRLSSAGRNLGVRNSTGDFVVFVDGHCEIPSKTFLRDIAISFEKSGAECLCRPQPLNISGNGVFQNAVGLARGTSLGHARNSSIYNTVYEGFVDPCSAGAMYRRAVFSRIGYYDESFDAAEDVEFNYRVLQAGLTSYISPRLAVRYRPREGFTALWRQMSRYGKGRFRLLRKHSGAFSITQIIPAALLVWIVLGSLASLASRGAFEVFGISLAFYMAAILSCSLNLARRHGLSYFFLCPPIFLTIHFGMGAGFLEEAFSFGRYRAMKRAL